MFKPGEMAHQLTVTVLAEDPGSVCCTQGRQLTTTRDSSSRDEKPLLTSRRPMHVMQIHTLRHTHKTKKYMLLETIYICQLDSETLSQEGMGKQRRPENETWLVECLPRQRPGFVSPAPCILGVVLYICVSCTWGMRHEYQKFSHSRLPSKLEARLRNIKPCLRKKKNVKPV